MIGAGDSSYVEKCSFCDDFSWEVWIRWGTFSAWTAARFQLKTCQGFIQKLPLSYLKIKGQGRTVTIPAIIIVPKCEMEYLLLYQQIRMSQSSVILALQIQFPEPSGHPGRRKPAQSGSHQVAATPYDERWGTPNVENVGCCLQIVEMHMKGMISMNPDSCIFPYMESAKFLSLGHLVFYWTVIFWCPICPLLQNFCITWLLLLPPQSSFLRVTWDAVSWTWSPKKP